VRLLAGTVASGRVYGASGNAARGAPAATAASLPGVGQVNASPAAWTRTGQSAVQRASSKARQSMMRSA
jgi:hypothetical protein